MAQLWPILLDRHGLEIAFAHQTFAWGSEARGKAAVHVIITGLEPRATARPQKRLFSYPDIKGDPIETRTTAITPYLTDGGALTNPHVVVREASRPLNGLPRLLSGSQPIDGGHLIFDAEERDAFLAAEPQAAPFLRPFVGAQEFLQGKKRWILALQAASPTELKAMPLVLERLRSVRDFRLQSKRASTLQIADTPTLFNVTVLPETPFLVLPKVSSERRNYAPIGWLEPPTVPSDLVFVLQDATPSLFSILTSAMHMAWLRCIGGRLKSDYRYSIGLVYNTFPMPPAQDLSGLDAHAQAILDARAHYPDATLADLYDPDLMPADLRRAHRDNDRAVDRLYRRAAFPSEAERVAHLLGLYEAMEAGLLATPQPAKRARRATSKGKSA